MVLRPAQQWCAENVGLFELKEALCSRKRGTGQGLPSAIRWRGTLVLTGLDAQSVPFPLPSAFGLRATAWLGVVPSTLRVSGNPFCLRPWTGLRRAAKRIAALFFFCLHFLTSLRSFRREFLLRKNKKWVARDASLRSALRDDGATPPTKKYAAGAAQPAGAGCLLVAPPVLNCERWGAPNYGYFGKDE